MSLRETYAALELEIAAIDAKAAPLIEEGKAVNEQLQELFARQREITVKLAPYRGPDYVVKKKLLGQMAIALGGKSLKAEPMR